MYLVLVLLKGRNFELLDDCTCIEILGCWMIVLVLFFLELLFIDASV